MLFRYPKPGTPNPLVSVHTFSLASYRGNQDVEQSKHTLSWPNQLVKEDQIISDMFWVHDDALMLVEVDRSSKKGSVVLFTDDSDDGLPVRKLGADGEQGDEGWIDPVSRSDDLGLSLISCDAGTQRQILDRLELGRVS